MYDTVIVGAGPAGIGAAIALLDSEYSGTVLLIERGRLHSKRVCPVDLGKACKGCAGICNVLSGFAGSIHYGDSVKLSAFPAGRRLQELLGPSADSSMEAAIDLLSKALGERIHFHSPPATLFDGSEQASMAYRAFPVASLDSEKVRKIVTALFERLMSDTRLTVRFETEVIDLVEKDELYTLKVTDRNSAVQIVKARNVVVGVGRAGLKWWHDSLRSNRISFSRPKPSVGLRFEMNAELLRGAGLRHPDFKVSIGSDVGKFKSFCFCAGSAGGRIKFADYGDFTLLDGHVDADAESTTTSNQPGNFALLYQLSGLPEDRDQLEWITEKFIEPYKSLRPDSPGKPVAQLFGDFRERKLSTLVRAELFGRLGHVPSVHDLSPARLDSLFTPELHRAFCETFVKFMGIMGKFSSDGDVSSIDDVLVIGLELEGLWDVVDVDVNLQTISPNLYAAGDALGVAQGILQATASGMVAGRAIANKQLGVVNGSRSSQETRDRIVYDKYWSVGEHYEPSDTFREMVAALQAEKKQVAIGDLGCGIGRHALYAAKQGASVFAVDYSDRAIDRLKASSQDLPIRAVNSDFRDWLKTFGEQALDGIVCFDAIHHVSSNVADVRHVLGNMERQVRNGGIILITLLCDIDYGEGDWPKTRLLLTEVEAQELLDQAFDGAEVLRRKRSSVHFPNTTNLDSATGRTISTHYRATRLIGMYRIAS